MREGTCRIYKWLHGVTDGLIAAAPLIVINDLKIAYNPMFVLSKSFPNLVLFSFSELLLP